MKVTFDKNDIVVVASAYGPMIVRTEHIDDPDVGVFLLIDTDSNFEPTIEWKGSFESCMSKMATMDAMTVALAHDVITNSPDPQINDLIKRN